MLLRSTSGCMSRRDTPLRAFPDRASADEAARYALATYGNRMVPYRCDRCGFWHLCPADRHTPSHECTTCSKRSYETEEGAKRRAAIIEAGQGVCLRVYACPYGDGWHLTSRL